MPKAPRQQPPEPEWIGDGESTSSAGETRGEGGKKRGECACFRRGSPDARLTGPCGVTAHACNGAEKFAPAAVGLGWRRKRWCVAHEFKWDGARDREKYVLPRERWGEMRKSSLLDIFRTTVFYIPQKYVSSAWTSYPRCLARIKTRLSRGHDPFHFSREVDSFMGSLIRHILLKWIKSEDAGCWNGG